jgi:hypothetical protein
MPPLDPCITVSAIRLRLERVRNGRYKRVAISRCSSLSPTPSETTDRSEATISLVLTLRPSVTRSYLTQPSTSIPHRDVGV